ncbi:hypothetical protein, partial [Agreia sp.]|uniref:hypothetical protein n=1 Tax=Agreia sp. TaxID=1872416 RepID=UPI0035BC20CF
MRFVGLEPLPEGVEQACLKSDLDEIVAVVRAKPDELQLVVSRLGDTLKTLLLETALRRLAFPANDVNNFD